MVNKSNFFGVLLGTLLSLCANAASSTHPQNPAHNPAQNHAAEVYAGLHYVPVRQADGLSHHSVTAIARDGLGFTWIGTQSGLNRFDGDRVKVYRSDPANADSLPIDAVSSLAMGEDDVLWIGTLGGGLAQLDLRAEKFRRVSLPQLHETRANIIQDLALDSAGNLWVASEDGLDVVARDTMRLRHVATTGSPVRQLVATSGGIWAVTTTGLLLLRALDQDPRHIDLGGIVPQLITRLDDEHLWVLSDNQLYLLDLTTPGTALVPVTTTTISNPRVLEQDAWGNVWLGGIGGTEVYLADEGRIMSPHNALDENAYSLRSIAAIGPELWLGTNIDGVRFVDLSRIVGISAPTPGNKPVVAATHFNEDLVLLGLHPGLYLVDSREMSFTSLLDADENLSVVSFLASGEKTWFSATDGIGYIDRETMTAHITMREAFEYPTLVAETNSGSLIMGTGTELVEIDASGQKILDRKPMQRLVSRLPINDREILVGGFFGLHLYDLDCRCTQDLLTNYPAASPIVTAIRRGRDDTLWIGTHTQGLIELNWEGEGSPQREDFRIYDMHDGLAANAIGGIEVVNKDVWISTTSGFSRFTAGQFDNFTAEAGASAKGYIIGASTRTTTGRTIFGGPQVITMIDSAGTHTTATEPLITDIRLANRSLPTASIDSSSPLDVSAAYLQQLELPYGSPALTIDFASPALATVGDDLVYRLAPMESQWTRVVEQRYTATYTSLPPGRYQFEVASARGPVRGLKIIITPPWYLQPWLIVTSIVFSALALWLGVAWRLGIARRRAEHLEQTVAERTAALRQSNHELVLALEQVKTLRGIVPICSSCKNIRDDDGYWRRLEEYMHEHTEAEFSHGICDTCVGELYPELDLTKSH